MKNPIEALLCAGLLLGPAGLPAQNTPKLHKSAFGVNLIVNGDAEAGPGAPDSGSKLMPIPGWTRTGVFQVQQYGASGGFPDRKSPGPENRGKNFFAGGPGSNTDVTSASQTIDLSALSPGLSAGKASYTLSAFIGGFADQGDYGYVTATFLDAKGKVLTTEKLGPVMRERRMNTTGLFLCSLTRRAVPAIRRVVVKMVSVRHDGAYHDGYFDNLVLSFKKG